MCGDGTGRLSQKTHLLTETEVFEELPVCHEVRGLCEFLDLFIREILQETVELLAAWLGNIVDLLDPDVIVMGGGVAAMLKPFFDEIKNRLPSWCVNPRAAEIPLLMAHYGADAGIAGAAALCAQDSR